MESLISDESLLEKSKVWSNAMEKFCNEEEFKEVKFEDIHSDNSTEQISDDNSPNETLINENNNEPQITCKALVKVDNFEGETSSDDFDELTNQTMTMMKEQQNKWEKFGMLKILESFNLEKISKVVVPWVEKNKLDRSQLSTSLDEHIVHIEEHRQVHIDSDNDSLHSLDTANYIRSSRKNKHSRCTTTTIKKFSYVKGSRKHLEKKFGIDLNRDINKAFFEKYPPKENRPMIPYGSNLGSDKNLISHHTPPMLLKAIPHEPRSAPERKRRSKHLKRRSDISKRSVSSSSSSSSKSPVRPLKAKYRKSSKINVPHVDKPPAKQKPARGIPSSGSESSQESKKSAKLSKQQHVRISKNTNAVSGSSNNETGFLGASIINSTALSNSIQPQTLISNPIKKCLLTPIKGKSEVNGTLSPSAFKPVESPSPKSISSTLTPAYCSPPKANTTRQTKRLKIIIPRMKIATNKVVTNEEEPDADNNPEVEIPAPTSHTHVEENGRILLYCPENLESHKQNVNDKRFYLTREHFLNTVGKRNSRRFIKLNSKKFPFEFDCTSRIYFKVPDESEESASSDEDILYMFGREGKLIVECLEQTNAIKK